MIDSYQKRIHGTPKESKGTTDQRSIKTSQVFAIGMTVVIINNSELCIADVC